YGAGGKGLGKKLAEILNIPYYDKELLSETADALGFSKELFMKADERKPSLFRSFLSFNYGSPSAAFSSYVLSDDNLYRAQSHVIKSIAEKGPCIIVGRTADYVLRDHPGLVSIFVHAPIEHRAKIIMERGEAKTEEEAMDKARKLDKSRESYYNFFTNRNWGHADNYHLSFNSSVMTIDDMADFIASQIKQKTVS
ncbi:MAG: cytidylate kinase-like family protein, partial [Muribaculaceae bacterium]|nr:cytidylate kinase-like family protein [Muribaculaceae bacterium]